MTNNIYDIYLDKRKMGKTLHRHYSLRSISTHKVSFKSDFIILANVDFVVQKSGQISPPNTGKKYVHAFLKGHLLYRGRRANKIIKQLNANNEGNPDFINIGYNHFFK